jgi:hypothetical protein
MILVNPAERYVWYCKKRLVEACEKVDECDERTGVRYVILSTTLGNGI